MSDDKTIVAPQVNDLWTITDSQGNKYTVNGIVNIGRDDDNQVFIDDGRISRHHAKLSLHDGQLFVQDLDSTNGCYVNDKRVEDKASIVTGDKLSFDTHHFSVVGPQPAMDDKTMVSAAPLQSQNEQKFEQAIPNSWVEQPCGEGTQLLSADDMIEESTDDVFSGNKQPRLSDNAHLIFINNGLAQEVIELTTDQDQGLWEIGREPHCQVQIDDPSISSKHAQIIFKNGRWSIANLLSTNGIEHNGERKLSAFLSDGDHLQLGVQHLLFFSDINTNKQTQTKPNSTTTNKGIKVLVAAIAIAILLYVINLNSG